MTQYIAYEGDDRLTAPTTHERCEQAIRRAKTAAGSMAKRRQYRIVAASEMDEATMCQDAG